MISPPQSATIVSKDIFFVILVKYQHLSFTVFSLKVLFLIVTVGFFAQAANSGKCRRYCWCFEKEVSLKPHSHLTHQHFSKTAQLTIFLCLTLPLLVTPHLTAVTFPTSQLCLVEGIVVFLVGLSKSEGVVCLLLQPCTFLDWTGICSPCRDRCTSCQKTIPVAYRSLLISACRLLETQA